MINTKSVQKVFFCEELGGEQDAFAVPGELFMCAAGIYVHNAARQILYNIIILLQILSKAGTPSHPTCSLL